MSKMVRGAARGKRRDLKLEGRWREVLARQERSGTTAREFCGREGLKESAFHFWKRELARRDSQPSRPPRSARHPVREQLRRERSAATPALVPVRIGGALGGLAPTEMAPIEISLAPGVNVRVGSGCEEALLRMVLSALESRS